MDSETPPWGIMLVKLVLIFLGLMMQARAAATARARRTAMKMTAALKRVECKLFIRQLPHLKFGEFICDCIPGGFSHLQRLE